MAKKKELRPRSISERVDRVGLPKSWRTDLYHVLLTISWARLFALLVALYVVVNGLFACGYLIDEGGLENARTGSFADAFFFSVQTMATIGYGKMVPRSTFTNVLVTIEALFGLLGMALATGLMFAKFSRPTSRITFSKHALVSERDGVPSLVIRMANERGNQVVEATLRLVMLRTETTAEGEQIRRIIDLKLARSQSAVFALTWTAYHPITPDSPLYGVTPESFHASDTELMASIVGIDDTFAQTVHARHTYFADEVVWGGRFTDILTRKPNGRVIIDYRRFHDLEPIESIVNDEKREKPKAVIHP